MTVAMLMTLAGAPEMFPELRLWRWVWAREADLISREQFLDAIEKENQSM